MNILVLGSGGREHALVWKLTQSSRMENLYSIPGNGGISKEAQCFPINLNDFKLISNFIAEKAIDFTIVGPEQPLADGLVDFLEARDYPVFGPNKAAAQIEGSKIFAKNLLRKYDIPTAGYQAFSNYEQALNYLESLTDENIVIKADGLAAGKGSLICGNQAEAQTVLKEIMVDRVFSGAGDRVVIEEFMRGQEASLFVLTDGKDYVVLSPAQDFKRALDNDQGKNTGGMGSYAPTPVLTKTIYDRAIREIVEPTLNALQSEGITYKGVLYCGLMITNSGPKVVEFNCRFGDPETQVVLPLLKGDLLETLLAVSHGEVSKLKPEFSDKYAVCVIAASGGYPDAYEKGKVVRGLEKIDSDVMVFHAGTTLKNDQLLTSGGRVLGVTALDPDLKQAADKAYENIARIHFDKMQYRRDIAAKAWKMAL